MHAHAVRLLFANTQHLLVDVTDHSPRLSRPVLLCRVVGVSVLPGWSPYGASCPPPLLLLLITNILQETEGDVTWWRGGDLKSDQLSRGINPATPGECFTCSTCHV